MIKDLITKQLIRNLVTTFFFFTATPVAYGSSPTGAEAELQLQAYTTPQQHQFRVTSVTYAIACSSAESLTH